MTSLAQLNNQIITWHQQHLRVVLVTGVFDLLHIEHVRFLSKAKKQGDKLIVGVETDARVARIKGPHRPIHSLVIRLEQLEQLKSVDTAFALPDNFDCQSDWEHFMMSIKPDIYAVSSHTSFQENKQKICHQAGVTFKVVHEYNPAYSTTKLAQQINTQTVSK